MPIIKSDFKATFPFTSKHFSTMYRTIFTKPEMEFVRKRIKTHDKDFLDLDISTTGSDSVVVMIHGLEGSSDSKYIGATANYVTKNNYDVIVINLRGCSGELNKLFKAYHTGETGDLHFVIQHIIKNYSYKKIALLGFSLGGNVVLKYAGEQHENINPFINKVISISPPCDLKGASQVLAKKSNTIYMKRFLNTLVKKAIQKASIFPNEKLEVDKLLKAKNFADFDNLFTAPSFGFKDANDYWEKASCKPFLEKIKVPSYLLTAKNDPFLSESCIPYKEAENHPFLKLEITKKGGHIGFMQSFKKKDQFWLEKKILKYLNE